MQIALAIVAFLTLGSVVAFGFYSIKSIKGALKEAKEDAVAKAYADNAVREYIQINKQLVDEKVKLASSYKIVVDQLNELLIKVKNSDPKQLGDVINSELRRISEMSATNGGKSK